MASASVLKIEYKNDLRRVMLPKNEIESGEFVFDRLKTDIHKLYKLPDSAPVSLTYTDVDKDLVTMANDQDFKHAVVDQCLSPLRIYVTLPKCNTTRENSEAERTFVVDSSDSDSRQPRRPPSTPEIVIHADELSKSAQKAQAKAAKAEAWSKLIREIADLGKTCVAMMQELRKYSINSLVSTCGQQGPNAKASEDEVLEEQGRSCKNKKRC